jgi:ribosomal protein S18 acetylase RimI-like enzyme
MSLEGLELRRAGPADALAIRALTRSAYAKWVPVIGREPLPMAADYNEAVQRHLIDLLYAKGGLVGLIEIIHCDHHLFVENLAVSPDAQGQGYGRALLAHAERLASDMGYAEIRLLTNKRFIENVQLYRRLGYRIDREEAIWDGFTVHMSKRL